MNTIKTMTLDDVKNFEITPQMADEMKIAAQNAIENGDKEDEDCPFMTKEELQQFRPWYEIHQDELCIESDILHSLIKLGKNWKMRMNQYLRKGLAASLI